VAFKYYPRRTVEKLREQLMAAFYGEHAVVDSNEEESSDGTASESAAEEEEEDAPQTPCGSDTEDGEEANSDSPFKGWREHYAAVLAEMREQRGADANVAAVQDALGEMRLDSGSSSGPGAQCPICFLRLDGHSNHLQPRRCTPSTKRGVSWKEVEIESDVSGDEGNGCDISAGSGDESDTNDDDTHEHIQPPRQWRGIQAKTLRGIIRKCHAHATHLASLDSALKDLGPIGHFRNPPRPARGMALSRKVEGSIFGDGV